MLTEDTDRVWEHLGKTDPYWAVLTEGKYHKHNLTEEAIQEFFARGEAYVAFVLRTIRRCLDETFSPTSALDFGCGVGRLVVPLAGICSTVVGVDVSEAMLQEARERCQTVGLSHVRFEKSDDRLSRVTGTFDLINSFMVLQHIPCARGEAIAHGLVARLNDGGVGVLHFNYTKESRSRRPRLRALVEKVGLYPVVCALRGAAHWLRKWVPLESRRAPEMQMNVYNLNSVLLGLQAVGVRRVHVEFTNHDGCYGVLLFFKKQSADQYFV